MQKESKQKPAELLVRFRYSDGHYEIRLFQTKEGLDWHVHNEGDHLIETEIIK